MTLLTESQVEDLEYAQDEVKKSIRTLEDIEIPDSKAEEFVANAISELTDARLAIDRRFAEQDATEVQT